MVGAASAGVARPQRDRSSEDQVLRPLWLCQWDSNAPHPLPKQPTRNDKLALVRLSASAVGQSASTRNRVCTGVKSRDVV
jgi:hypothetical protein